VERGFPLLKKPNDPYTTLSLIGLDYNSWR
jgi:hypothetical protein